MSAAELKLCPFCGGKASVGHYETESLWSHDQVTYTQVGCSSCDIEFSSEPGYEVEAPEAWNTRTLLAASPDPQASAPGGGVLETILERLEQAKYQPGDHPIVPVRIDGFMKWLEARLRIELANPARPSPQREGGAVAVKALEWMREKHKRAHNRGDHAKQRMLEAVIAALTPAPEQAHQAASGDEDREADANILRQTAVRLRQSGLHADFILACSLEHMAAVLTPANPAGER